MGRKCNRGRIQAHNGRIAPCRQDDNNSQGTKRRRYCLPHLPEEIWQNIHTLMPMRDAARIARASRAFLNSWRCHPNLTFTKETLCAGQSVCNVTASVGDKKDYNTNIECILKNHSRSRGGVKKFMLEFHGPYGAKAYNRLNHWLEIAMTLVLEELALIVLSKRATYKFSCSRLSDRIGDTIRHLHLDNCVLHPTSELCLRNLTVLHLHQVRVMGNKELGPLLSNSLALEKLILTYCIGIVRLNIPCMLQQLSYLKVIKCSRLHVIENKAPNFSSFEFAAENVRLSLGELLRMKNVKLDHRYAISYAIKNLPSTMPELETLHIHSSHEPINARMVPSKFLDLKVLNISIHGWRKYDFLSLASFLHASPSLETFVLLVSVESKNDLIVGYPSTLRQMPHHHHDKLKSVKITGFCPKKSLVELTRHILESATPLKSLILDTIHIKYRCSGNLSDRQCSPVDRQHIEETYKSIMAVKTYIEGKVPSTVKLNVLGPCSRCHAL